MINRDQINTASNADGGIQPNNSLVKEIRFSDPQVDPPKEIELHLRTKLSKVILKCQGKCGKVISATDTLIMLSIGSTSWIDRNTGENRFKYGPLYIHLCIHF